MTTKVITETQLENLEDALIETYLSATDSELDEALQNLGVAEDFRHFLSDLDGLLKTEIAAGNASMVDLRKAYERERTRRSGRPEVSAPKARERIDAFLGVHPEGLKELGWTLQFRELESLPDDDVRNIYWDLVVHGLVEDL